MESGNLIVAFILKTWHSAKTGIDRRRRISSLRQNPDRLAADAIVCGEIEKISGIKRITLSVQSVAGIFDKNNLVGCPKAAVIKAGMRLGPRTRTEHNEGDRKRSSGSDLHELLLE